MNKIKQWLYRFMYGRYGSDNLNRVISILAIVLIIVDMFLTGTARLILWAVTLLLLFYIYFRMFSRNITARRRENEKFMQVVNRIKNTRYYRYFNCPTCKTKIRVPKHKGNIQITCPKCRGQFIKKT